MWGRHDEANRLVPSCLSAHYPYHVVRFHAPITSARRMLVPGSLVTSLTLHSHPRSRGERSGSERSEKERNEPREMGCEGKDIRPEFLMASASRRSWSVRSPFVTLHLPFPTRSEASGRDERSGMEGRVTGCGWNGFFGRLSSCPYILSSSLLSLRSSLLTLLTPSVVRHSRREPKGVGRGCRTKSRRHGGRKTRPDDGRCEGGMNDRRSACHLLASVPLSFGSSFHSSCRSFLPTSVLSAFGSVPEVNRKVNERNGNCKV